jgi:hypothetical protein
MRLVIREIHAASSDKTAEKGLNDEWIIVVNSGDKAFSTAGCSVLVGRGKGRLRQIGTLDPGFTLQPGESVRIVTGNPGKKAHGAPPTGEPRNYHLFLAEPILAGPGTVVALALKQHEVARGTFDPAAKEGVAAEAAS